MTKKCSVCGVKMGGMFGAIESLHVADTCGACVYKQEQEEREKLELEKKQNDPNTEAHRNQRVVSMLVTTVEVLDGYSIAEYLGVARGGTVRAKHVGSDFLAGVKNIVGGEIKGYTALMADAREEAMYRMKLDAFNMGADAVVGVNFSTSMIDVGAAEITAFGTGVKLRETD